MKPVLIEKEGDDLIIAIKCKYSIVDDCFCYNRLNSASEGKRLLMEVIGEAFEEYVKGLATNESDFDYLDEEFKKVKVIV